MKLGVITDCFKVSTEEAIKKAGALKLSGVQIYATGGEFCPDALGEADIERYKKLLNENGLVISALCGDMGGHGFEIEGDNRERIEKTKRIIDLAAKFNSHVVTTHIGVIPADTECEKFGVMLRALKACGDYAVTKGVTLAIETGPESAPVLYEFVKRAGNGVGVNLDPANFVMVTGQDPAEAVRLLGSKIVHTHLKDGKMLKKTDPKIIYDYFADGGIEALNVADFFIETPIGEGDVDFKEYFKALSEIGYDGYLTIERETGGNPEKDITLAKDFIINNGYLNPQTKMRYGVSSYSFRNYMLETKCDYFKICDLAKEMGYEGIEFIPLNSDILGIDCCEIEMAKQLREHCEKIGLEIIAYTVGGGLLSEDIEKEEKRIRDWVDVTEALGAKIMRHDSTFVLPDKPFYSYREAIKDMAPVIRRITEYAKSKGIRTCTENHGMIMQAPERMEQLIREVANENYGWLVDIGNFLVVDYNPVEAVKIAAPYAFHVHAKDFIVKKGDTVKPYGFGTTSGGNYWRGTVLGHGSVPIINCLSILKRAGYNGWVSVEFEGMENNLDSLRAGIQYLKDVEALI